MKISRIIGAVLLSAIFSIPAISFAGFGVSPGQVFKDKLVPGSSFVETIMLVQGAPESALPVLVSIESSNITDWISFPDGSEFIIPKGVQQYPLKVRVDVPKDAELDIYKAFVRIATDPSGGASGDNQIAVTIGGRIDFELTVGDDVIVDYEVVLLDILDIKEGDRPEIKVKIRNNGNVPAAPDSASFDLFDKFGQTRLAFATSRAEDFEKVAPFSEDTIIIDFPLDIKIAVGQYRGHAKVFDDEGTILREVKIPFDVLEKTFLEKYGLVIGIVAIVLILGVGTLLFILRKRKKSSVLEI